MSRFTILALLAALAPATVLAWSMSPQNAVTSLRQFGVAASFAAVVAAAPLTSQASVFDGSYSGESGCFISVCVHVFVPMWMLGSIRWDVPFCRVERSEWISPKRVMAAKCVFASPHGRGRSTFAPCRLASLSFSSSLTHTHSLIMTQTVFFCSSHQTPTTPTAYGRLHHWAPRLHSPERMAILDAPLMAVAENGS